MSFPQSSQLATVLSLLLAVTLTACAQLPAPAPVSSPITEVPSDTPEPAAAPTAVAEQHLPPLVAAVSPTASAAPTPPPLTLTLFQSERELAHGARPEQSGPDDARTIPTILEPLEAPNSTSPDSQLPAPDPPSAAPRRISDAPPPAITARYVAILDERSGELLHAQDEHTRVAPASITKIATALVALEREPDVDRRIPVTISGSAMAARDHSSIMGLEPGRQVSLVTLLHGMMLPSGNDAAEQVALALGGSRETYVAWMNQKVADLGLEDTHFVNPSGMDAAGHYSSAYDMARLARAAMSNEAFRHLVAAAAYRGDGFSMANLNRLIGAYPGADGVKIGFTRAAGRTIVASATRDEHRVYVSLMRSQDLPGDSAALLDWVWRTFAW